MAARLGFLRLPRNASNSVDGGVYGDRADRKAYDFVERSVVVSVDKFANNFVAVALLVGLRSNAYFCATHAPVGHMTEPLGHMAEPSAKIT